MVRSSIILALISKIPDENLRAEITAQYYEDVEEQTNFAQHRVGQIAIELENKLDSTLESTNGMIRESVELGRRGKERLEALHSDVQSGFRSIDDRFRQIDDRFEQVGSDFEDFKRSIEDKLSAIDQRTEQRTDVAVRKVTGHIASITEELNKVKEEIRSRRPFFSRVERNSVLIEQMAMEFEDLKNQLLADKITREERENMTSHLKRHIEVVPQIEMVIVQLQEKMSQLDSIVREFISIYNEKSS